MALAGWMPRFGFSNLPETCFLLSRRPPLWSSGQSFWLQIQRSRVRSLALPDFLSPLSLVRASWGQLRSYLNEKSSGSRSRKQRLTAVGIRCADHVTPLYPQKLAGLVVRVSGYRYRGPGFDPRRYQIFWVHSASWALWGQLRSYLNEKK